MAEYYLILYRRKTGCPNSQWTLVNSKRSSSTPLTLVSLSHMGRRGSRRSARWIRSSTSRHGPCDGHIPRRSSGSVLQPFYRPGRSAGAGWIVHKWLLVRRLMRRHRAVTSRRRFVTSISKMGRNLRFARSQQNPAAHLDHVIPRIQGGDLSPENLTPACSWCNLSKGARVAPVNPPPGYVGECRRCSGRRGCTSGGIAPMGVS